MIDGVNVDQPVLRGFDVEVGVINVELSFNISPEYSDWFKSPETVVKDSIFVVEPYPFSVWLI